MPEKTYAQKLICSRINSKNKVDEFQDYQEHTDYTAYNDYNDYHGDYYDIYYGIPSEQGSIKEEPVDQSICKKIKAQIQSLYQKFALTNRR